MLMCVCVCVGAAVVVHVSLSPVRTCQDPDPFFFSEGAKEAAKTDESERGNSWAVREQQSSS